MIIYKGLLFPSEDMFETNSMLINLTNVISSEQPLQFDLYIDNINLMLNYGYDYICDNEIVYSMENLNNLMNSLGIIDPEKIKEIYGRAFNASYIYRHHQNFRFSGYVFDVTGITIDYLRNLYASDFPDRINQQASDPPLNNVLGPEFDYISDYEISDVDTSDDEFEI